MKLFIAFIFFLITVPQNDAGKISWSENKKLSWDDFLGKPDQSANFVASTNTGISFTYSYTESHEDIKLKYSVESFFYPERSWFKPSKVSLHILSHEQTHFDISELHARILRKKISNTHFSKRIKREIEDLYNETEQQRRAMQTKFDAETDHSRNIQKERYWQKYVSDQLEEYERWN